MKTEMQKALHTRSHRALSPLAALPQSRPRIAAGFLLIYLSFVGVVAFGHQHGAEDLTAPRSRTACQSVALAGSGAPHLCIACELQANPPRISEVPPPPQPSRQIVRRQGDPAPAERSAPSCLPPSRGPPFSS